MKPNFALTLSFDGIGLLHRVPSGWHLVGEVGLSSDDLTGELAVLRRTAQQLDSGGLACKLVIPNEQIRYLTIDTPGADDAARARAARDALDGATPYPVDELRIDWAADGARTHVAAVARETLDEAEAFASEHQFGPVSFVATPPDGAFVGEAYFGACSHVSNPVERDPEPIHIIGMAHMPLADTPPPDETDKRAPVSAGGGQQIPDTPKGKSAPKSPAPGKKTAVKDHKAPASKAPTPTPTTPAFSSRRHATAGDAAKSVDPAAMARTLVAKAAPRLTFGLRSADDKRAKPNPPNKRSTQKAAPPRADTTRSAAPVQAPAGPAMQTRASRPAQPDKPATAARLAKSARTLRAQAVTRGKRAIAALTHPLRAAGATASRGIGQTRQGIMARMAGFKAMSNRTVKPSASRETPTGSSASVSPGSSTAVAKGQALQDEEQKMTIFGARRADSPGHAAINGRTRNIGLIVAAGVLLILAGVGVWATVNFSDGAPALLGERAETQAPPDTSGEMAAIAPSPEDSAETGQPPAPLEQRDGAEMSPSDTERPAQPPVAQNAPEEATPAQDEVLQHATSLVPRPDEAAARYAATGIWPAAPGAPNAPSVDPLENVYSASLDTRVEISDAVALPPLDLVQADPRPRPQTAPAIPGTRFELDDRGLVTATPEGTISPDGVMIYAGAPPARPSRLRTSDTRVQDALRERLSSVRPKARPENLANGEDERSDLDKAISTALAGITPKPRPEEIAAPARDDAPETIPDATAQAVHVSLKPELRPDDLNAQAPRRTASVVAPEIPTSASVAKQATVENAIKMRQINLIGVYGKPSSRRALVRLPNGQFKKVKVGDPIDGGRVAAIGETELRYIKRGRNLVLTMPRG